MSAPFDIGRFLVSPGRDLYGFLIRYKFGKEVLVELASLLAKYNIEVLYYSTSMYSGVGREMLALVFIDFTESDISPHKLVNEMKKFDFIEEVITIQPKFKGFIADTHSFPLMVGKNRAIIIGDTGYKGFIVDIRKRFGSAAETFLYYLGYEAGEAYCQEHMEIAAKLGIDDAMTILNDLGSSVFTCTGFGKMEIVKFKMDPPHIIIRVYNNFECELGVKVGEAFSHLLRGMIAGYISTLLNTEMIAKETKCIAIGDPYCEFEVTSKI